MKISFVIDSESVRSRIFDRIDQFLGIRSSDRIYWIRSSDQSIFGNSVIGSDLLNEFNSGDSCNVKISSDTMGRCCLWQIKDERGRRTHFPVIRIKPRFRVLITIWSSWTRIASVASQLWYFHIQAWNRETRTDSIFAACSICSDTIWWVRIDLNQIPHRFYDFLLWA
jgi:hypothetical protein